MSSQQISTQHKSPLELLDSHANEVLDVCRKAKKNRKSLNGDNHYANKLLKLRAEATNAFQQLNSQSAGDSVALAELIDIAFGDTAKPKDRLKASRELRYTLKITWGTQPQRPPTGQELFPMTLLSKTKRGYLLAIGRQMNGCFTAGWFDACAVMMRRLIEVAIIEAFEANGIAGNIKDASGIYLHLTDLVGRTLAETHWSLTRNTKKYLPTLKEVGHLSAHGRYYSAQKSDIENVQLGCRVVVEELLHHAKLLS